MRRPLAEGTLAIANAKTQNRKLGDAATTYAAQTSCPTDCVFFDGGGCYAEAGAIGKFVTAPLNAAARSIEHDEVDVARAEAQAIDALEVVPGRPLRLHTVGDCRTAPAARIVAEAARRYVERGGGPVWTYTHAWRDVPREAWGDVSVLASCETLLDVLAANQRGYATALVVEEFQSKRRYEIEDATVYGILAADVIPCPSQTRDVHCSDCKLCFRDDRLRVDGLSIAFEIHGTPLTTRHARLALSDPENPARRMTSRDHAEAYRREHGELPTAKELVTLSGVTHSSAWEMLRRMRAEA